MFTIRKQAFQALPITRSRRAAPRPRVSPPPAAQNPASGAKFRAASPSSPPSTRRRPPQRSLAIARREQQARGGAPQAHGKKTHRTLKEQQEYLVSSIPGVGNAVAKNLLRHFGSVERVFAATEEELKEVELVGPKTAERIRELVGGEYKG